MIELIVVTLVIAMLFIPLAVIIYSRSLEDSSGNIIQKTCFIDETSMLAPVHNYINLVFWSAVPSIGMFICNIVMTVSLTAAAVKVRIDNQMCCKIS